MLDTVCIHRRRDRNVGDFACTPGHYLDFGQTAFCDFAENAPASRLAILGGGQVFRDATEACIYTTSAAKKKVVWGVGILEKDRKSVEFDILQSQCALITSFSHKFKHFKDNPVFGDPRAWKDDLARAEHRPDTLEDARTRNFAFYDKVRNL